MTVWHAACRECHPGALIMSFTVQDERNGWATRHTEKTGHRVECYHCQEPEPCTYP